MEIETKRVILGIFYLLNSAILSVDIGLHVNIGFIVFEALCDLLMFSLFMSLTWKS